MPLTIKSLRTRATGFTLLLFAALQVTVWSNTSHKQPFMEVVPPVPSITSVKALSLGDDEFYFRWLGFNLQNFGDTFKRFTALKDYDYNQLRRWFELLDKLNPKSSLVPAVAAYYYSNSQNLEHVEIIVDYLAERSSKDISANWWWMAQASNMANFKLKDKDLALQLAMQLSRAEGDLPMWARQLPAFILEGKGEKEAAATIINDILKNHENIPDHELNFMRHYLSERLQEMQSSQ